VTASSVEQLPLLVLLVVRPFPGKKSLEAVDYGRTAHIGIQKSIGEHYKTHIDQL